VLRPVLRPVLRQVRVLPARARTASAPRGPRLVLLPVLHSLQAMLLQAMLLQASLQPA